MSFAEEQQLSKDKVENAETLHQVVKDFKSNVDFFILDLLTPNII